MKKKYSIIVVLCLFLSMFLTSCGQEVSIELDWFDGLFSFNDSEEYTFGNSPLVVLEPEEYLPGDQLYDEDHPDYFKEGTPYMTAEIERGLKDLWDNHPALPIIMDKLDFPENIRSFGDLIEENILTGRKELSDQAMMVEDFLLIMNHPDDNGNLKNREIYKKLSEEEIKQFIDFEDKFKEFKVKYTNNNSAGRKKDVFPPDKLLEQLSP